MSSIPILIPQTKQQRTPVQHQSSNRWRLVARYVINLLPAIGFLFLTYNVITSAYHARQDRTTLVFVLLSYADLLLLFLCLEKFQSLEADNKPEKRQKLKVAIWVLATALNLAFAWRVARIMPGAVAVVIWAMSSFVAAAGFYCLLIYKDEYSNGVHPQDSEKARLRELSPEEKSSLPTV